MPHLLLLLRFLLLLVLRLLLVADFSSGLLCSLVCLHCASRVSCFTSFPLAAPQAVTAESVLEKLEHSNACRPPAASKCIFKGPTLLQRPGTPKAAASLLRALAQRECGNGLYSKCLEAAMAATKGPDSRPSSCEAHQKLSRDGDSLPRWKEATNRRGLPERR